MLLPRTKVPQLNYVIVVIPFIPLAVFEEVVALDPLSLYPNPGDVGGTEWKRTTEIASDIFERCPGREWIRNVTQYANTWKCKSPYPIFASPNTHHSTDRWNAITPHDLAEAPWEHSK